MFLVATWLCVAAWLFSTAAEDPYHCGWILCLLSFTAAGAGIGAIAGKSVYGALWGLLVAILIALLMPVVINA